TKTCSGRSSTPKSTFTTTNIMRPKRLVRFIVGMMGFWLGATALAQEVCLPAPRLLTMMPMGGQAGTSVEVTITGEYIDGTTAVLFSDPGITVKPKASEPGKSEVNTFVVTIAPDARPGIYDARVLSRLGISSARAFSVGGLPEVTRSKANTSLETALE